jgi:hypothetical protein|tara:strand:- start:254 stop:382 length:129 start_codon:yes stop_codon:yes gene_type:complete
MFLDKELNIGVPTSGGITSREIAVETPVGKLCLPKCKDKGFL